MHCICAKQYASVRGPLHVCISKVNCIVRISINAISLCTYENNIILSLNVILFKSAYMASSGDYSSNGYIAQYHIRWKTNFLFKEEIHQFLHHDSRCNSESHGVYRGTKMIVQMINFYMTTFVTISTVKNL